MKLLVFMLLGVLLVGCSGQAKKEDVESEPAYHAYVIIKPFNSYKVNGSVKLQENFGSLKFDGELSGLPQKQKLALIFHSFGDCRNQEAPDEMFLFQKRHKVPYLHKFVSDKNGSAKIEGIVKGYSLSSSMAPVIGRSLIVHADLNDFTGQYSGKFEKRIGCGIIGASKQ